MKFAPVDAVTRGAIVHRMSDEPKPSQRDKMRALFKAYGDDEAAVCSAYAKAEKDGKVARESNDYSIPAEAYARALWRDGISKGWLA